MTNVVYINDQAASVCVCGSVKWNLLKSGRVECAACGIILTSTLWADKSEAYVKGRENHFLGNNGPNPYAEESEEWNDFELGWGEASNELGQDK